MNKTKIIIKSLFISIICLTSSLFANFETQTDAQKYPFIHDAYNMKKEVSVSDQLWAFFDPLSFLIGKGISNSIISKKDSRIEKTLTTYSFDQHKEFMNKIMGSDEIKERHKAGLISLATEYKDFRIKLDKDTWNEIKQIKRTNNANDVIDMTEIPYMEKEKLDKWVGRNYENENKEKATKTLNNYKYLRRLGDNKLNVTYFKIIKD